MSIIDADLLKILCCPETHQPLEPADDQLVQSLNQQIEQGRLCNRGGDPIKEPLQGGLVRSDRKYLYPIRNQIPIMLIDEAISLPHPVRE